MTGDNRYERLLANSEWRASNMCEVAERLEKIGIEKGEKIGVKKGENKFALLMAKLYETGREDDAKLAITDETFREQLYKEYNITD